VARGSGDLSTEIISKVLYFLIEGYIYGIKGF